MDLETILDVLDELDGEYSSSIYSVTTNDFARLVLCVQGLAKLVKQELA